MSCFNVDWSWPSPNDPGGTYFGPLYDPETRREIPQRPPRAPATTVICLEFDPQSDHSAVSRQLDSTLSNVAACAGWKSTIWGRDCHNEGTVVMLVDWEHNAPSARKLASESFAPILSLLYHEPRVFTVYLVGRARTAVVGAQVMELMLLTGNHANLDGRLLDNGFRLTIWPGIACDEPPRDSPGFDGGWALDHLEEAERAQVLIFRWRDVANQLSFKDPQQRSRGIDSDNHAEYEEMIAEDLRHMQDAGVVLHAYNVRLGSQITSEQAKEAVTRRKSCQCTIQ